MAYYRLSALDLSTRIMLAREMLQPSGSGDVRQS
jgi:hypothetical protein